MAEPTDLAEVKRQRGAQDNGRCVECGRRRIICQPWGRDCLYRNETKGNDRG